MIRRSLQLIFVLSLIVPVLIAQTSRIDSQSARISAGTAASAEEKGMDRYRSLARMAMDAVKNNDLDAASKHCQTLEKEWDDNEGALRKSSPDIWKQADQAMDQFIHPIMRAKGKAPDAAALEAAYQNFLDKLKLAEAHK